jgi:hypothetical protein
MKAKMKKYQDGGKTGAQLKKEGVAMKAKGMVMQEKGQQMKTKGQQMKKSGQDQFLKVAAGAKEILEGAEKRYPKSKPTLSTKLLQEKVDRAAEIKKERALTTHKTGGMVNSNSKVSALKSAGSKGVKSGVNPKAAAQKVAKGRVGGISKAPKTANPKSK